jgi:hypothetical protein
MSQHGPYLLHDRSANRFYRERGPEESHGHWQRGTQGATFYATKDEAERTMRRICGRLTRHLTHVVTIAQAVGLAKREEANAA